MKDRRSFLGFLAAAIAVPLAPAIALAEKHSPWNLQHYTVSTEGWELPRGTVATDPEDNDPVSVAYRDAVWVALGSAGAIKISEALKLSPDMLRAIVTAGDGEAVARVAPKLETPESIRIIVDGYVGPPRVVTET